MLELGSRGLFTLQFPDHPLSAEIRQAAARLAWVPHSHGTRPVRLLSLGSPAVDWLEDRLWAGLLRSSRAPARCCSSAGRGSGEGQAD